MTLRLFIAYWLLAASAAIAQERLPPVEFENPPLLYEPILPAAYPGDLSQPVIDDYIADDPNANARMFPTTPEGYIAPQQFSHITKSKDGFFQKLYVADTYIPRGGTDGLGFNDAEIALSVALPLPTRRHPVVITPGFTTHFLDGPANTDLPARLYDAYVAFNWYPRITRNLGAIISITPTVQSDFEHWDDRALRTPGKALLRYTWAEYERELVLGVIYLDRDDIPWLPAAGVIWTPNPYLCFELLFPRPRVMFMVNAGPEFEDWLYVAGEYGGGSWSIERVPAQTQDVVTFADYRAIVGWERKKHGGAGMRVEAGYVFGRSFEYESNSERFKPDAAWMIRGSLAF
jgi:hypothetical protein